MASHWPFEHLSLKLWAKEGPGVKLALKVENRPLSDILFESAIRHWKDLDKGYNFVSDLVMIGCGSREL
jgi:hypothetical protein